MKSLKLFPFYFLIWKELIIISKKNFDLFKTNFNYEEDNYDRLKKIIKSNNKCKGFTNKGTFKSSEFDYEEDPYEPGK